MKHELTNIRHAKLGSTQTGLVQYRFKICINSLYVKCLYPFFTKKGSYFFLQGSPIYKHLQDTGYTDFEAEACKSHSFAEFSAETPNIKKVCYIVFK